LSSSKSESVDVASAGRIDIITKASANNNEKKVIPFLLVTPNMKI
jgi:hypothetical protein